MQWEKRTDIELFDDKDLDRLFLLRKKFSSYQFSSGSVQNYLSHIYCVEQDYLERFTKYKELFLNILEGTKQGWIVSNGVVPAPAKTTAETILNLIAQPFLKSALRFYNKQDIPLFLMDADFSFGIIEIPAAIIGASTEEEGGGKAAAGYGMIQTLKQYGHLPSRQADNLYNSVLKSYRYHRKLFEKDRTGKILLASVLSCLEAGENAHADEEYHHDMPSLHNKTLYLAGSYFGKKVYEGLYDLWQKEGFAYEFC